MDRSILHRYDTLSFQTDLSAGLGSFRYPAYHVSIQSGNPGLSAEYCRRKRNLGRCVHIHAFPLKSRFWLHMNFQKQIA